MKLYIVRHGETNGNLGKFHQSDETPLNQHGIEQAKFLANRFHKTHIDLIIASPSLRTRQTAAQIEQITHAPVEHDELYKEKRNPSEVINMNHDDAKNIWGEIHAHFYEPNFHYSDEENAQEFITRITKGLALLEKQTAESLILVTHGYVIRAIIGLIMKGQDFSPKDFELMIKRFMTTNTGVTMCEYTHKDGWRIIAYNDHSHLLE